MLFVMSRIPSLDGLRAISIAMVLLGHLGGTRGFLPLGTLPAMAGLGVRVFFVISGFLITTLLLREWATTGKISLSGFYLRRTRRIFPAFYTFVGVMALTGFLSSRDFWHALTYTTNFDTDPNRGWYVGHIWSLSVEEQFYLLWPVLFVWAGPARALWVAAVGVLAAPLFRGAGYFIFSDQLMREAFPMVMDSIATGCLLAAAQPLLAGSKKYQEWIGRSWILGVPLVLVVLNQLTSILWFHYLFGQTLSNILIALLIDHVVRFPAGRFGKVLNLRPLVFVGTLSYSLYLWQQPFLNRGGDGLFHTFPLNLSAAIGCALVSYYLVERPMLRLGNRRFSALLAPSDKPALQPERPSANSPARPATASR